MRGNILSFGLLAALVAMAVAVLAMSTVAIAQTMEVLHSFNYSSGDGVSPQAGLIPRYRRKSLWHHGGGRRLRRWNRIRVVAQGWQGVERKDSAQLHKRWQRRRQPSVQLDLRRCR
jgi:hypothetical protein